MIGFISDERCKTHPGYAPEVPKRWIVLDQKLKTLPGIEQIKRETDLKESEVHQAIVRVHSDGFYKKAKRAFSLSADLCTDEVPVTPKSWDAAQGCIQSIITACEKVSSAEAKEGGFIFCNNRAPGHHCGYNSTHGFCVFNTALIGAAHAIEVLKQKHVAIFDFDVHASDGSAHIIKQQPHLKSHISLYSIHERYNFPSTEATNMRRMNDVEHSIYYRALNAGCSFEEDYKPTFLELLDIVKSKSPDIIIISCGFDSCAHETIANFPLLPQDYKWMTEQLLSVCPRVVSTLEGGYNLTSIGECLEGHVQGACNFFKSRDEKSTK